MTLLYRIALLGLLASLLTACETLYLDQPMQSPATQVYVPINSQPQYQPQPVPAGGVYPYPSQPQPAAVPVPAQAPPAPSKAVAPPPPGALQPIDGSSDHVIPVRAPNSISDLPDPS
jgi:hypothetical protein